MRLTEAIRALEKAVPNPSTGLPDEVFFFISKITPLVNVDLLIKDEKGRTLLAWRDDEYCGTGWHIPGGIVRHKERLETRIKKVAETEIGTELDFDPNPVIINQFMYHERQIRSHFISILYRCSLPSTFVPQNEGLSSKDPGYLQWHEFCPSNLIPCHEVYRKFI
ncbi:MAG: NUDIX hydrolase [Deltaproteobacteria bacterium]|nr:MAG: NUDIX hydrolase [Deltaproteobacteria bacterium]